MTREGSKMSVWLVSSSVQRIELDGQGRGEITFTVVNAGPAPEQAVFDVKPGPGADRSWFEIFGPSRLVVIPGAAVDFEVACTVPAGTAVGRHTVQGVAYSAGRPDTVALSNPVELLAGYLVPAGAAFAATGSTQVLPAAPIAPGVLAVPDGNGATGFGGNAAVSGGPVPGSPMPAPATATPQGGWPGAANLTDTPTGPAPGGPAPAGSAPEGPAPGGPGKPVGAGRKRRARLLIAAAAALVVLLAIGAAGFFFLRGNDDQGEAASPPAPPPAAIVVPDVTLLPQEQAVAILEVSNLTVGEVVTVQQRTRQDGTVFDQSIRQGRTVEPGTAIDLAVVNNDP